MNSISRSRTTLAAGVALAACLGFAAGAQAQTQVPNCTIANWGGGATGLTDANTGHQGTNNRRYGGPCGLRVPVNGTPRYVTDDTPSAETAYAVRFYAFLNNAGSSPITLFAAGDGGSDNIQVLYNTPSAGNLTLRVRDKDGTSHDSTKAVGPGWHSAQVVWTAGAGASIKYSVDGAPDQTVTADTSGLKIETARLGNVNGAAGSGSIDFDDFHSNKTTPPGRLLVGDANNDETINASDLVSLLGEINGSAFAAGQPDCNGDGSINASDLVCVLGIINQ